MSTTTVETSAAVTDDGPAQHPRRIRGRGERSLAASLASHGILIAGSVVALFPVGWLVFLSLGPDEDDYLHPGGIWKKMTFDNYSFVLQHTSFFAWLKSSLIVLARHHRARRPGRRHHRVRGLRMRFPGYRKFMWVLLVTQMFPVAVLMVPMYQILSDLQTRRQATSV